MPSGPPEGYVEVADRITAFYGKYPEGSLRCKDIRLMHAGEQTFFVYTAQAFRTPDDPAPAEGVAWEPVPGKTNFTRDSEAMNAETSAWGRAIAALGFEVHSGIASANEVRNRQGGEERAPVKPSDKQVDFIGKLVKQLGADGHDESLISGYVAAELTGGKEGSASKVIEQLKSDDAAEFLLKLAEAAQVWQQRQSDVPADDADFKQPTLDDESDLPWTPARG